MCQAGGLGDGSCRSLNFLGIPGLLSGNSCEDLSSGICWLSSLFFLLELLIPKSMKFLGSQILVKMSWVMLRPHLNCSRGKKLEELTLLYVKCSILLCFSFEKGTGIFRCAKCVVTAA